MANNNAVSIDERSIRAIAEAIHGKSSTGSRPVANPDMSDTKLDSKLEAVVKSVNNSLKKAANAGKISETEIRRSSKRMALIQEEAIRIQHKMNSAVAVSAKQQEANAKKQKVLQRAMESERKYAIKLGRDELTYRERLVHQIRMETEASKIRSREQMKSIKESAKEKAKGAAEDAAGHGIGGGVGAGLLRLIATVAGTLGTALAAIVGAVGYGSVRAEGFAVKGRQRYLNYGSSKGEATSTDPAGADAQASQETTNVDRTLSRVGFIASDWGMDQEALKSAAVKIATKTGEAFSYEEGGLDRIISQIARQSAAGLGTEDQLADRFIQARQDYGQNREVALNEMDQVARDAREIAAFSDGVIQMDDFSQAVQDVRGSMVSLTATQKGLSKAVAGGIIVGKKLGMTYNEAVKASVALTKSMTSEYNEGFATISARKDLDAVLRNGTDEEKAEARQILDEAITLNYDDAMLAERMKHSNLSGSDAFIRSRADSLLSSGGDSRVLQAMGVGPEAMKLMAGNFKRLKAGESKEAILNDMIKSSGPLLEEEKKYKAKEDAMQRASKSTVGTAEAVTDTMLSRLAETTRVLSDTIKGLANGVTSLNTVLKGYADFFTSDGFTTLSDETVDSVIEAVPDAHNPLFKHPVSVNPLQGLPAQPGTTTMTPVEVQQMLRGQTSLDTSGYGLRNTLGAGGGRAAGVQPTIGSPSVSPTGDININLTIPGSAMQKAASVSTQQASGTSNQPP